MNKKDLLTNLVTKSIVQLVKKEDYRPNVDAKEIIADIEDSNNESDIDRDRLPATGTAYLIKNKKYKGGLKKYLTKKQSLKKDKKKSKEK